MQLRVNHIEKFMIEHEITNSELGELLVRCMQQDRDAFKALYDSTSPRLYATLYSILRVEAVAEEALQETYVRVWKKASEYQSDLGQPMTWMTSIARYHALDILRKRRIREDREIDWQSVPSVNAILEQPDPAQMAEHQDILAKCFERLSESQSLCIVRAYLEGLTHEEISKSVKSPVGTVKSWIRRGLVSLKECINEHS